MVGHAQNDKQTWRQKSGPKREQDTHIPCRAGAQGTGDAAKFPPPGTANRRPSHQALSLRARR
eukprot:5756657-Amphidinium_carterae.1